MVKLTDPKRQMIVLIIAAVIVIIISIGQVIFRGVSISNLSGLGMGIIGLMLYKIYTKKK